MSALTEKTCRACQGGVEPLSADQVEGLRGYVPTWTVADEGRRLTRSFKFPNFAEALAFVNRVGELAEREGHHPDIRLSWGRATIELTTHKIGGLSESDFIMAAKIDELPAS